ncbi:hypothetical protein Nepgr_008216 [Nepenthes gracilis]|uniref:Late embryogenesis abundant protein n=1 Tax=Nepenthes gracilis TaxID=150966 RepID=A0AAD3XJ86_NEPGR|nr:hypothetical protein Nepgr_008216 [Nepenthes gracilis]
MESSGRQTKKEEKSEGERKKGLEGLPLETSPYVKYEDLEDYKRKGYGAEGHLEINPARGAGASDAPTPSGAAPPPDYLGSANRQGVP